MAIRDRMDELRGEIQTLPQKRRFNHLLKRLIHEHDSPKRLSFAIATGVFIGTLPFFGLHMWIGLIVALMARLNKLAVFLGTQISLPWIAPLLIVSSIQIGEWTLHRRLFAINISSFTPEELSSLFVPWLVGSIILGIALGLLSYAVSLSLVLWLRRLRKQD